MTTSLRADGTQTEAIRRTVAAGTASRFDVARAFGVMVGPSFLLDAAAAGAVVATVRALAARRRPRGPAALGTALLATYVSAVRPWLLRWGATDQERRAPLPGDELVPDPAVQSTRAVTIDAAVDAVWP